MSTDHPDRNHGEEPPPRRPVLLGLADRCDHGQPHRQHRACGAALPPHVAVQIGAAAVPPIALLAAVHGIALAVRAGASGRVYCWAVSAAAAIGVGAFAVSFLALRDLMLAIGYTLRDCMGLPRHHRHSSCRQHRDAGCARGQTRSAHPHRDHARQYTNSSGAAGGAERKTTGHASPLCAGCMHRRCKPSGKGRCIGTTRPGADAALSASRSGTGRCRPCVRSDCIRGDDAVRRDRNRSALGTP